MIKVCKFGGSSLASGEQFAKMKNIVSSDDSRRIVVVSAPGRRYKGDSKITDLLYICRAHLRYDVSCEDIFSEIEERYREIVKACGLSDNIENDLKEIRSCLNKKTDEDYIVSRGEYLCAKLVAEYLDYKFIDSTDWLFYNYDGKVDYERSYAALSELIITYPRAVLPGFYGSMPDGAVKVFSRGGSDITGAVAAAAVNADAYENWTDVSGIMMADPRIVSEPKPIERVTFSELRELSYMGADVLHEETVFPVRQKNIPLYIKNTNAPSAQGTLIMESFDDEKYDDAPHFITGISGKKDFSIITISKARMTDDISFIRKTLEITEKYGIAVEHIPSSIDSFSLVISTESAKNRLHEMISDISRICEPDSISVTNDISLVAVVGRRMAWKPGVSGKLFAALGKNDINIRMIEQGSDEINIMIGVENKNFEKTIRVLYDSFT